MRVIDELRRTTKRVADRITGTRDLAGEGRARQAASLAELEAISAQFEVSAPDPASPAELAERSTEEIAQG